MPKTPVSHIQSTAPGPPARMAVATPTMLPVPMVAESAVVSAPNWLMSPSASGSFVMESLMASGSLRWMNPVRAVRNRWLPRRSTIMGTPQTNPSTASMIPTISMCFPSSHGRIESTPRVRACKARTTSRVGSNRVASLLNCAYVLRRCFGKYREPAFRQGFVLGKRRRTIP